MQPKFCYRVEVQYKIGMGKRSLEVRNYEVLMGAVTYRNIVIKKPNVTAVRILHVLDEASREDITNGLPMS